MSISLPVRYLAMDSTGPDDNVESNIARVAGSIRIEPSRTALVIVDAWNGHHVRSHMERVRRIIAERIVPVLHAARKAGVTVVHAPSPRVAERYPQWLRYAGDAELSTVHRPPDIPPEQPEVGGQDDWPPADFRARTGQYAALARPPLEKPASYRGEPPAWWRIDAICDSITPEEHDCVVATGEQLHRLLRHRRILYLVYAGFATNVCILYRDYGIRAMRDRGYLTIVLRDCTTAIECRDTVASLSATEHSLIEIERWHYTATGSDLTGLI